MDAPLFLQINHIRLRSGGDGYKGVKEIVPVEEAILDKLLEYTLIRKGRDPKEHTGRSKKTERKRERLVEKARNGVGWILNLILGKSGPLQGGSKGLTFTDDESNLEIRGGGTGSTLPGLHNKGLGLLGVLIHIIITCRGGLRAMRG